VVLYTGSSLLVLKFLKAGSVQCVVTSPPYWGLRDYGVEGQLGLEASPAAYVERMVEVFHEVQRVLRDDGTLWLNLSSSYNSQGGERKYGSFDGGTGRAQAPGPRINGQGFKPKDMVPIPWMVAMALQADGWYLRSDIIWAKPNPMPESMTDRPTKSHEYLFLLTKSPRYFYDATAIVEPAVSSGGGASFGKQNQSVEGTRAQSRQYDRPEYTTRNARDVWTMTTRSFKGAHFAVFPPELPERCIKAGTRPGDLVLDPFVGSGTSCMVSNRLGRRSLGIDLNAFYIEMAKERVRNGK